MFNCFYSYISTNSGHGQEYYSNLVSRAS